MPLSCTLLKVVKMLTFTLYTLYYNLKKLKLKLNKEGETIARNSYHVSPGGRESIRNLGTWDPRQGCAHLLVGKTRERRELCDPGREVFQWQLPRGYGGTEKPCWGRWFSGNTS